MSTPEQPQQQHPPPGWYPDPEDPSARRYWDGTRWAQRGDPISMDKGAGPEAPAGHDATGAQGQAWQGAGTPGAGVGQAGVGGAGFQTYGGQPMASDSRTWALLAHLSPLLLGFIGPLIAYLIKKDEDPFVRDQAAEALNFNISWSIYVIAWSVLSFILAFVLIGFLMFLLLIPMAIAWLVLIVLAAVKANQGITYRYPVTIRMVS